ncbi:Tat pathway signal protein [Amycolatopsis cynarae]|uniref:Tat pathway signal protein n=1 Tax=Amycolatopsis cynarae TaxID=2995223 RepID=A0ABY7AWM0_9PSEU|nr:Tat pathway signal protein [Amycolatopsis sp. HUAS 11-8]WAL63418.1 Tat pathway signal protein [Amycolatopsis sp. HUAS 11-8]
MRSSRLVAASLVGVVSGLVISTAVPASALAASHAPTLSASANPARGLTLTLPAPRGRYATGESTFRLVDGKRPDPWVPSQPYRELMISVFYPAVHTGGLPFTNQFPAAVGAALGAAVERNFTLPAGLVDWAATKTHSVRDATMAPGRFPVVLYSPGAGDPRNWNVSLAEYLASHGFVVVTIDHTGDAPAVQFPDGHVVGNGPLLTAWSQSFRNGTTLAFFTKLMDARMADTELVLNRLTSLPVRLSGGMDLNRIGMFGHSAGGFTTANMMFADPRIKAGINMDGTMEYTVKPDGTNLSEVALHGLDRPFLLMGSSSAGGGSDVHREPSWAAFWQHQRGWKADVTLDDSVHASFTDAEALLPQLAGRVPAATLAAAVGTVDPHRAVAADRAVVASFFDRFLKGHNDHLLDGGASRYPITFVQ